MHRDLLLKVLLGLGRKRVQSAEVFDNILGVVFFVDIYAFDLGLNSDIEAEKRLFGLEDGLD